jgi:hypothetical protein
MGRAYRPISSYIRPRPYLRGPSPVSAPSPTRGGAWPRSRTLFAGLEGQGDVDSSLCRALGLAQLEVFPRSFPTHEETPPALPHSRHLPLALHYE